MDDSMVTGRIKKDRKEAGNAILARDGLTASQAIGMMYERLETEQSSDFLSTDKRRPSKLEWQSAARFVDSLAVERKTSFDDMDRAELKRARLASRGLM